MERKHFLRSLGLIAGSSFIPKRGITNITTEPIKPSKKRVLRIAHLTDIHISDNKNAQQGLIKCLHHLQTMHDGPDLIINGGDAIEDALFRSKPDVNKQWALWFSITKNECGLPIQNIIGNHDIWGMYTEKKDFLYGKNFAQEKLHLDTTYYSRKLNGWHIIYLDSTQKKRNGLWYTAKLGDEQMDWLKNELSLIPATTPVMVVSHIPILCVNVFLDDVQQRFGRFHIPGTWMHNDVKEIVTLFNQYKNVKLCLSGHIHLQDKVEYNGVTYCCNGAVSGDWWKNEYYHETKAGYGMVDLYDDGSFENNYLTY